MHSATPLHHFLLIALDYSDPWNSITSACCLYQSTSPTHVSSVSVHLTNTYLRCICPPHQHMSPVYQSTSPTHVSGVSVNLANTCLWCISPPHQHMSPVYQSTSPTHVSGPARSASVTTCHRSVYGHGTPSRHGTGACPCRRVFVRRCADVPLSAPLRSVTG